MQEFIGNNFFPIVIAILSGFMLFWSAFGNRIRGIKEVDHVGALQLINHKDATVLDIREESEFKRGHLLNAKWIPIGKLKARIGELEKYKDKPLVVVCRTGSRSGSACAMLVKLGFDNAYILAGGIINWQKQKLPLEKK
ncbi:MAG: rhodanese-like domain-containing protein [Gallionella sp.]